MKFRLILQQEPGTPDDELRTTAHRIAGVTGIDVYFYLADGSGRIALTGVETEQQTTA